MTDRDQTIPGKPCNPRTEAEVRAEAAHLQREALRHRFTYHSHKAGQASLYAVLRDKTLALALAFDEAAPISRERAIAITKLEEASFWINAAIARHG